VLLADGTVIADAPAAEILGHGRYFVTECGRIVPGALRPEDALALLARQRELAAAPATGVSA
jgi:hypothetical protein